LVIIQCTQIQEITNKERNYCLGQTLPFNPGIEYGKNKLKWEVVSLIADLMRGILRHKLHESDLAIFQAVEHCG
jgi:hypothetical protein